MLLKDLAWNGQLSSTPILRPKRIAWTGPTSGGWRNSLCLKGEGREYLPKRMQTIAETLGSAGPSLDRGVPQVQLRGWGISKGLPMPISDSLTLTVGFITS